MSKLITTPNLTGHDELYDRLVEMHEGLTDVESRRLDARLLLLLINHIGDADVVLEAIGRARGTKPPRA